MSCAMPNNNALESGASVGDAESYAWLCRELDEGLHALAQPLTILRGALGALTMRGAVPPQAASRYLEMSNTQVDRLCNLLSGLQSLLDGVRSEPVCTEVDLWDLTVSVLENRQAELSNSLPRISLAKPDCELRVMADPARIEEALHAALNAVEAQSQSRDDICMDISRRDGFANLSLLCTRSKGEKLTAMNWLHLSAAEANVKKQHGVYACSKSPFQISIKLPLLDEEKRITGIANSHTLVHES
ncbi:MAG: hypothetical protein ABSA42_18130 [Terracidiphilus sp.]